MKAHTKAKDKQIILSIGMIVKNEEKVLERCLKSLQPLMKAIPSELIIADTGSTDSTVEIAKKYTDNVFHFEWINDFAAARNSTLKKAKGKWYFFLDADEYLDEDIHEIVEFFQIPQLYNHYRCAEITMRNYTDPEKRNYTTCMLPRFHRLVNVEDVVEFDGTIHETIYIRYPFGYFQTILHHTGYAFSSTAQLGNKRERNLALMREEYRKTEPEDRFRILSLLLDSIYDYPEEREKYIKEGLDLVRINKSHMFSRALYLHAISYYSNKDKLYALDLCDEYFNVYTDAEKYVSTVDLMQIKAYIYVSLGKFEEAYNCYVLYDKLYDDFKNEKMDISDLSTYSICGIRESDRFRNGMNAIECLLSVSKYDEAFELLLKYDPNDVKDSDYILYTSTIANACIKSRTYNALANCYKNAFDGNGDDRKTIVLKLLETTFYNWTSQKDRKDFAKQMVDSSVSGKYIDLMRIYNLQNDNNLVSELIKFIESVDNWKDGYSEAIYLAVKNNVDIIVIVDKLPSSLFAEKLSAIANTHDDFAEYVLNYGVPKQFFSSIKRFNWIVTMHEVAVYRCFELNDKKKYELYLRFTNLLGEYVSNIYNPELLQDEEDIAVLPPLHKFGYYMLQANNNLINGDSIGYIKEMKRALLNCEPMKEIVEFMLEQFKIKMGLQ